MKFLILLAGGFILSEEISAQADTLYRYYKKDGRIVSADSADVEMKIFLKDTKWFGIEYFKDGVVKSSGFYTAGDAKIRSGESNNYTSDGKLDYSSTWENGSILQKTYYYKSGNKKSFIKYGEPPGEKGWDETGNEIKNFIVEREASYKGGEEKWTRYLSKTIDVKSISKSGTEAGQYKIIVKFMIDTDGSLKKIEAKSDPVCAPCVSAVTEAISSASKWQPAILNNEPVKAYRRQPFTIEIN